MSLIASAVELVAFGAVYPLGWSLGQWRREYVERQHARRAARHVERVQLAFDAYECGRITDHDLNQALAGDSRYLTRPTPDVLMCPRPDPWADVMLLLLLAAGWAVWSLGAWMQAVCS